MNTKNFLLAIAILVAPYLATAGINQKNNFQSQQEMGGHHSKSTPADNHTIQWELIWPYDDYHHNRTEKIGKIHNFHFERFYRNRRKMTTYFLVKILLYLVHASSFLLSVIKVLH
jgi:hypothetical protein